MRYLFALLSVIFAFSVYGQETFTEDPLEAMFISSDIPAFWAAFDNIDAEENPFITYLNNGSVGLKDFIPNRIESPQKLLKVVKRRLPDYEAIREQSLQVNSYSKQILLAYQAISEMYAPAIFPPTYFVIGAFNTGGTATNSGLIIGVEKQVNIEDIPYIVAHEIIHFNQNYAKANNTLLKQSIIEGSADFIGELISGNHPNEIAFRYGNSNEKGLCAEFVKIMDGNSYKGWLYGSKGKKKGRPKDLGYWMGYKICAAYYNKSMNKTEAIAEMLNIQDVDEFLSKSCNLDQYTNK